MQDFSLKDPPIQDGTNITKYCVWDRNLKNISDHRRPEPFTYEIWDLLLNPIQHSSHPLFHLSLVVD